MHEDLRLAEAPDFAAIAELTNGFIRHSAVHFGNADVTAGELRQQWTATDGGAQYPWLVAVRDGAFAGYAKASSWRQRAAYAWTVETTIYLDQAHRGAGLGRRLYARLLAVLRAQGRRSVIAGITLPNAPSVALHEALGFQPCGVVRDAGCKHGRWHDVGFWQLRLRADAAPGGPLLAVADAFAVSS